MLDMLVPAQQHAVALRLPMVETHHHQGHLHGAVFAGVPKQDVAVFCRLRALQCQVTPAVLAQCPWTGPGRTPESI